MSFTGRHPVSAAVCEVTVAPAHGGQICPEEYERYMPCSLDPCPIDCEYSEWSGWSPCDASCGPGEQIVTRMVIR